MAYYGGIWLVLVRSLRHPSQPPSPSSSPPSPSPSSSPPSPSPFYHITLPYSEFNQPHLLSQLTIQLNYYYNLLTFIVWFSSIVVLLLLSLSFDFCFLKFKFQIWIFEFFRNSHEFLIYQNSHEFWFLSFCFCFFYFCFCFKIDIFNTNTFDLIST